jgi:hypothetical protein
MRSQISIFAAYRLHSNYPDNIHESFSLSIIFTPTSYIETAKSAIRLTLI